MNTARRFLGVVAAFALVGAVAGGTRVGLVTAEAGVLTTDSHTVLLDHFDGSTVGTTPNGPLRYAASMKGLGKAGQFGPGTYVQYAMAPSATDAGTVEMWIKPTSGLTATTGLLNFNWDNTTSLPSGGWVLQMGISSSSTTPRNVPYGNSATGSSSVPLKKWSHLALTWSPTSTKLYLNGALTGSGPGSPPIIAGGYFVYLNYWGTAASGPFTGLIDELRISDIDRSAAEIAADAGGAPGPPSPPGPAPAVSGIPSTYYNIAGPGGIVTGPDGNIWFTNGTNDTIGRISPDTGAVTIYTGLGIGQPNSIAVGADHALWFTNNGFGGGNTIGRIDPTTGLMSYYTVSGLRALRGITLGPDGAMWFTSHGIPGIGRIATDGTITVYPNPDLQGPEGITAGVDRGLWFTDDSGNIGRIDSDTKAFSMLFTSQAGTIRPTSIASGPDGYLWFTNQGGQDSSGNQVAASIASISTSGSWHALRWDAGIVQPAGITVEPDGSVWFTNQSVGTECPPCGTTPTIGRITADGVISYFTDSSLDDPAAITTGPDGALWFTNMGGQGLGDSIGRITTTGEFSGPYMGNRIYAPNGIVGGPDGAIWFTNTGGGSSNGYYSSIGRVSPTGEVTSFTNPQPGQPWLIAQPERIIVGPDGNLWFTNNGWGGGNMIDKITPSGQITSYSTGDLGEYGITKGPDGAMWFTVPRGRSPEPAIGRITVDGSVSSYPDQGMAGPHEITAGPDGALWFTDGSSQIGRVTTGGSFTFYSDPRIQNPQGIVTGPDGALWFTNMGYYNDLGNPVGMSIGRIATDGSLKFYTAASILEPYGITTGPDGALWFTNNGSIGRITTGGKVSSYPAISVNGHPNEITTGPDGAMWFTEMNNVIGRLDTAVTPEITGFTRAGSAGTSVTISGVNLGSASRVTFNGTAAAIVTNTATQIVVLVPAGAVTGPISVTTSVGTATSSTAFTVI